MRISYARYSGLSCFIFTITLLLCFKWVITLHVTVPCLVIFLTYVSLQVLQRVYSSAGFAAVGRLPERPFSTSFITAKIKHLKLNCKHGSYPLIIESIKGFYFTYHCMCRTQIFFTRQYYNGLYSSWQPIVSFWRPYTSITLW